MARSINEIQEEIIAAKNSDSILSAELTSNSKTSIWILFTYVVAVCIYTLEKLFDIHKTEMLSLIAQQKSYRAQWYVEMAKRFQYGFALVSDQDYYDNTGVDDAAVESSKVIAFAAAEELHGGVRIKVARLTPSGDLAPVPDTEFTSFKAYMERVKPMGVRLSEYYVNTTADSLRLTLKIAYDPLLIDATGKRIDGSNDTPVQDAITDYLQNGIEFNGLFKPMRLVDYVQAVPGVDNVEIVNCEARYGTNPYAAVGLKYQPYSGYLRFINPSDLILIFEPA